MPIKNKAADPTTPTTASTMSAEALLPLIKKAKEEGWRFEADPECGCPMLDRSIESLVKSRGGKCYDSKFVIEEVGISQDEMDDMELCGIYRLYRNGETIHIDADSMSSLTVECENRLGNPEYDDGGSVSHFSFNSAILYALQLALDEKRRKTKWTESKQPTKQRSPSAGNTTARRSYEA